MLLRAAILLVSFCVAVISVPTTKGQEMLKWTLQPGETLTYVVKQQTTTDREIGKQTMNTSMQQTMEMAWKVGEVTADGDATVAQSIDRMQIRMEGDAIGEIQFDTNDKEEPANPLIKSISRQYRRIIGQSFNVTMKPSGKLENVEVPAELLKLVTESKGPLTEETLKQTMEQTSIVLPEKPVAKGDSWNSTKLINFEYGSMKIASTMTYEGKDPATGLAIIAMKPSISMTSKDGSETQMKLTSSEGSGRTLFDLAKGRISRSDLDVTMQMQLVRAGQSVNQTLHQKTAMQLVP